MLATLDAKFSTDKLGIKQLRHRRYYVGVTLFWSASSPAGTGYLWGRLVPLNI